jgi:hypothetical protein
MRTQSCLISGAVAIWAVLGPPGHAAEFYTVDQSTSRLKIVSTDGQLTDIGPLGRYVTDLDLATLNGHLYGIDSIVGDRADLLEIDRMTGAASLLGVVTEGNHNALQAEALCARDRQLWIGYSLDGAVSKRLSAVSLTGAIDTNALTVTNADIDSLDWAGTQWRIVDVNEPFPGASTLWGGVGPALTSLATAPNDTLGINDLEIADGDLWGIRSDNSLVRLDPDTGAILQTVTFADTGTYESLALVPEPAVSPCVGAIAALGLLARRPRLTLSLGTHQPAASCREWSRGSANQQH